MDPLAILLLFCVTMFLGSYLAGSLPVMFPLSQSRLQLVTALGAGLLVGTALAVIIPEGIETVIQEVHKRAKYDVTSVPLSTSSDPQTPDIHSKSSDADTPPSIPHQSHEHEHNIPHTAIGVAMTIGFVFMLLVDSIGSSHGSSETLEGTAKSSTATIGLVIHSAADGIALGAAANLADARLELVIFLAIMLHKAPAGFGLVSFLLHEGFNRHTIRYHLLAFSLAAPLTAVLSHFCLANAVYALDLPITGLAMLFSAGTFLYVATVHVLSEISHRHTPSNQNQSTGSSSQGNRGLSMREISMIVIGSLLPLIFNAFHSH